MQQKPDSFMDSKTIIAIVLVAVVWLGWQNYLTKKYPQTMQPKPKVEQTKEGSPATIENLNLNEKKVETKTSTEEQKVSIENLRESFEISSYGMSFRNVVLKEYRDRNQQLVKMGELPTGLFGLYLVGESQPIDFAITKKSDLVFEGQARVGDTLIQRTIEIQPETLSALNKIEVINPDRNFKGLYIAFSEQKPQAKGSSFLLPSFDHQEVAVHHDGKVERTKTDDNKEPVAQGYSSVELASLGSHYFTSAVVDKSELIPSAHLDSPAGGGVTNVKMIYQPASPQTKIQLQFVTFAGPKALDLFKKIDPQMADIVNFGFFSGIAKVLLAVLKWFHNFIGNWGLSIVFLTLLVRLLVLPFNVASYKSMKKMQTIQPMIQSLRERYKDDPTTLNREMMLLMKEQKVNPLGGCLPMLLQMPVFFALFQVLGQSVELYQSPFFAWITDLSLKDPYYILPALMGGSLWLQQKLTPTTMDPAQAKVMQFLPLVFSFMMISLPSGLTLYTFVSTAFGIAQQQLFMKDRSRSLSVKEIKV